MGARKMAHGLLLDDPRRARFAKDQANMQSPDVRSAMAGIVLTNGPNQRGGWVTALKCSRCGNFLNDGQRGYHINTRVVDFNGAHDERQLLCGPCFTQPRSALKPLREM